MIFLAFFLENKLNKLSNALMWSFITLFSNSYNFRFEKNTIKKLNLWVHRFHCLDIWMKISTGWHYSFDKIIKRKSKVLIVDQFLVDFHQQFQNILFFVFLFLSEQILVNILILFSFWKFIEGFITFSLLLLNLSIYFSQCLRLFICKFGTYLTYDFFVLVRYQVFEGFCIFSL